MLFYIKCPSCSRIISNNLDKFFADIDSMVEDPASTKINKNSQLPILLDKYGIRKICCRSRILGLIPAHKIIKT